MSYDPLPNVPRHRRAIRCEVCGRTVYGLAWLVEHYKLKHPVKEAA